MPPTEEETETSVWSYIVPMATVILATMAVSWVSIEIGRRKQLAYDKEVLEDLEDMVDEFSKEQDNLRTRQERVDKDVDDLDAEVEKLTGKKRKKTHLRSVT